MMKGKTDMISVNAFESRLQREILDLFGKKVAVYRRCFLNEGELIPPCFKVGLFIVRSRSNNCHLIGEFFGRVPPFFDRRYTR